MSLGLAHPRFQGLRNKNSTGRYKLMPKFAGKLESIGMLQYPKGPERLVTWGLYVRNGC